MPSTKTYLASRPNSLRLLFVALCLAALLVAGCGGDDDKAKPDDSAQSAPDGTGGTNDKGSVSTERARGEVPKKGRPKTQKGFPDDAPGYVGQYLSRMDKSAAARVGTKYGAAGRVQLINGTEAYNLSTSKASFGGSLRSRGRTLRLGPAWLPSGSKEIAPAAADAPCGKAVGVYRWSVSGKTLSFKRVRDSCVERRVLMDRAWRRKR